MDPVWEVCAFIHELIIISVWFASAVFLWSASYYLWRKARESKCLTDLAKLDAHFWPYKR